jgi:hypothetical protein
MDKYERMIFLQLSYLNLKSDSIFIDINSFFKCFTFIFTAIINTNMTRSILILTAFIALSVSKVNAQTSPQRPGEQRINPTQMMLMDVRINPKDTAMLNERAMLMNTVSVRLDTKAKIYSKHERDSIITLIGFPPTTPSEK